jgi:hypothetical protein
MDSNKKVLENAASNSTIDKGSKLHVPPSSARRRRPPLPLSFLPRQRTATPPRDGEQRRRGQAAGVGVPRDGAAQPLQPQLEGPHPLQLVRNPSPSSFPLP